VSRALTSAVSFDEILQLAVGRAATLLAARAAVLMLSDDEGRLTIRASVGLGAADATVGHALEDTIVQLQHALGVTAEGLLAVPLVVNGEVNGILAVALPEHAMAEDQEWLLSALADQTAVALEKTRLDERGRFRDRLIGIVSHDLRNPLNTVILGTSALLDSTTLDAYTTKTLTRILSAADRAARMISDLLDYTQAHLGDGIHVERSPNDLAVIARQVVDEVEIAHPAYELELVVSGDTRAALDADRMTQVLANLTSNAVSYSPPGTRIRVELRGEVSCVVVAVHNRGLPIPAERLADIFEPMTQVSPGSGRNQRSVGLGLYIVKNIVTSHHGTIDVTSSPDDGTTFTVQIPR
jgi:sigma-B regulation protein RsbU (phosphoserine phosphatase)